MYLYLDLIWLLNFLIDYLLLWLTGYFRKIEVIKWRLFLASFLGSSYVLFLFLPPLLPYYTFGIKICLSLLIIWVAFGFGNVRRFMLSFFMFYFVSFVTGGGMLAVHYLLQSNHVLMEGMMVTQSTGYGDKISWLFVVLGFPIMFWFSKSRWNQMEATKIKAHAIVVVKVSILSKEIRCLGLIDTGNQLYEPITRVPVMLLEASCFEEVIPNAIIQLQQKMKDHRMGLDFDTDGIPEAWLQRMRMVPYRGVQQGMEFMLALKPDQVEIEYEEQIYRTERVLLGINQQTLSTDGQFQAIVHPALVQKMEKEEAI